MFSRKIVGEWRVLERAVARQEREATAGSLSSGGCGVLSCAGGAQVINRLTDTRGSPCQLAPSGEDRSLT